MARHFKSKKGQVEAEREKQKEIDYGGRNLILKIMGFESYKDYLNSDLWQEIRLKVLEGHSFICSRCGLKANQVHHTSYRIEVLKGEKLKSLVPLCGRCHRNAEYHPKNGKTTLKEANKRLKHNNRKLKKKNSNKSKNLRKRYRQAQAELRDRQDPMTEEYIELMRRIL